LTAPAQVCRNLYRPTGLSLFNNEKVRTMTLREKIIHESLRQFCIKGFLNTSITEIIAAVGSSKGGLYNHFQSKEQLFLSALSEARKIWRDINLAGVDGVRRPIDKIKCILKNYRDCYLPDSKNLPGGCIFVNLAVELNDQQPHLAQEVNEGFARFKQMIQRLLDQEKEAGRLRPGVNTRRVTEMVFSGLLGACVMYTSDKSQENLNHTINALIEHLEMVSNGAMRA